MIFRTGAIVAAALSLVACGQTAGLGGTEGAPAATSGAEAACVEAVSANTGGARSTVLTSQPLGSGSLVVLASGDGTNWSCTTTETGVVAELSVV